MNTRVREVDKSTLIEGICGTIGIQCGRGSLSSMGGVAVEKVK
jgi:hypothetical protein